MRSASFGGHLKLSKNLAALKKYLTSDEAVEALKVLEKEVKQFELQEAESAENSETGQFILPKEISGKANAFAIFTDGACRGNPGPGSYAYMIQSSEGKVLSSDAKAFEHTTNNRMEMSAIIAGIKSIETQMTPFHEIYVYTDSKYVVDGMRSWVAGWKKRGWKKADKKTPENVELWKELDRLSTICHVHFNWVKGHAGHPQNEHVDGLCNEVLDLNGF